MEPIRILHMIGCMEMGGSQTMVLNLYRTMDRSKVQFDFIVDHPNRMDLADQFKELGAKIYTMPTFVGTNIMQVCRAWEKFFRDHSEYKILHSHVRSYASIYLPIAKKHGVKTIIHSHATSNGSGLAAMVKDMLQFPLRYQADYFFSCSQEAGEWLYGKKTAGGPRHYILKNAIDAEKYRFQPEVRDRYRELLGLCGKRVYAHVGRFIPAKNHAFLLRVFRRIRDAQDDTVLLLIGEGELRPVIETDIKTLDLGKDVILLGNRNDIPELLQAADVFLFPSVHEGLGIAAVEAQAAGLPCLCSTGVPPLAKVTDNCLFLPPDEEAWAKAAQEAATVREDTYNQIVAAGFDIHATAAWMTDFYCKL